MVQVPLKAGGTGLLLAGGYKQLLLSGWGVGFSEDIFLIRDQPNRKLQFEQLRSKLKTARTELTIQAVVKENFKCD